MKRINSLSPAFICCVIALVTAAIYLPLVHNSFIGFDDHTYIYQNPMVQRGISWDGIKTAFSLHNGMTYWHPLTWLSLMLDYELWGLNPAGYHLENLLLHIINAILLFTFLRKATGQIWPAAAVAGFFALHPAAVESVAWAVERKTVLSSLFFFLTLLSYLAYSRRPSRFRYAAVFFSMAIGLMAKSMIITLPFILLLLDYWPLRRLSMTGDGQSKRAGIVSLVIEKIPLVLLSCASVSISILSHAQSSIKDATPMGGRVSHAVVSYLQYMERIFWPSGHSVFYPLPAGHTTFSLVAASVFLTACLITAMLWARRYPWLIVGFLWYIIALGPVSGLIRAGRWPGYADRFLYLPGIGIFIVVFFALSELIARYPQFKRLITAALVVYSCALLYDTNQQVGRWKDSITLFSDAVRLDPANSYAHYLLGRSLLLERKDYRRAEQHLTTAISLDPSNSEPYYHADLGEVYLSMNQPEKALRHLQQAAAVITNDADVLNGLASALIETGRHREALPIIDKALALKHDFGNALFNRGVILIQLGQTHAAKNVFQDLLARDSTNLDARINLGHVLILLREYDQAIKEMNTVLAVDPTKVTALVNMGTALERSGDAHQARVVYQRVLTITPDDPDALTGLTRLQGR